MPSDEISRPRALSGEEKTEELINSQAAPNVSLKSHNSDKGVIPEEIAHLEQTARQQAEPQFPAKVHHNKETTLSNVSLPSLVAPQSSPDIINHGEPEQHPNLSQQNLHVSNLIQEAIAATNPSLRHLASHSSLGSQHSRASSTNPRSSYSRSSRPLATTFEGQRHSGKPLLGFSKTTRFYEPGGRSAIDESDEVTLFDQSASSSASKDNATSTYSTSKANKAPSTRPTSGGAVSVVGSSPKSSKEEFRQRDQVSNDGEDDDVNYPGPLGLFILIAGIALSVFLISLDRTIITTAVPYISDEFKSYDDIGWYGSAYLLTASAFQPLYGRIFMLFNMKWSYLVSLGMFELGSLICGVAPNSIALIVGRAIAGLGSAGILTGSFVVVSHAVPLHQRPVLTAVVGLMFGVGATAGPLLGGVFTDLVTWRWCFYFNLPVGGATAASMVFFFHPPKKHAMMNKSFIYRIMELDLVGNVLLLAAAIMLFLALQFTEERVSWGSPKVVGLLVGCGVMFIIFCAWQWWKADGALMPPRILKQRTVAASCAAGFFIYSAILIHTYYLPMYFQGVEGDSAIHSGVNMIPYVVANALFSLLAGIFVSKNGYFIIPAELGMIIGTVGCGLLTTLTPTTSAAKWIGYEILASAGIGMAIQQGFTAVQIVLPLDEVAIGTAAVVAFQSLGGAVFISVGNTILQNSLYAASANNQLPGIDIQSLVNAGAAGLRANVPAGLLPEVVSVYNSALSKVFVAAIPMAGLAALACAFMEMRNVKDQDRKEEEAVRKALKRRSEIEEGILEKARQEKRLSDGTVGNDSDGDSGESGVVAGVWRRSWFSEKKGVSAC